MSARESPLLRKIATVLNLSEAERAFVRDLDKSRRPVSARTDLVKQGERYDRVGILQAGWAIRYKTLSDGRRHVINFLLPGDVFGVFLQLFEIPDHSIAMLTDGTLAAFETHQLVEAFRDHPRVAAAFTWFAAREESIIAERATSLGRRTALERMAHIVLELYRRLEAVELAGNGSFELPVTQEILADTLGLSLVHANRTLRKLREIGLVDIEGKTILLQNIRALKVVADFDDLFLYIRKMPENVQQQFIEASG